jgi:hypothetical protein
MRASAPATWAHPSASAAFEHMNSRLGRCVVVPAGQVNHMNCCSSTWTAVCTQAITFPLTLWPLAVTIGPTRQPSGASVPRVMSLTRGVASLGLTSRGNCGWLRSPQHGPGSSATLSAQSPSMSARWWCWRNRAPPISCRRQQTPLVPINSKPLLPSAPFSSNLYGRNWMRWVTVEP